MPEFDYNAALTEPVDQFSVSNVTFHDGRSLSYIVLTPADGSPAFNVHWYMDERTAEEACETANKKQPTKPFDWRRAGHSSQLVVGDFGGWLHR